MFASMETDMRVSQLALLIAVCFTQVGCRAGSTPPSTGPVKLQDAIIGSWRGAQNDYTITYDFDKDGTYTRVTDGVKESGKWQAVDEQHVELSFTLTKEQAEAAKPIWQAQVDVIDRMPKFPGAPERLKPPEPKEGENKLKYNADVTGDVLALGAHAYRRVK
jgi:hypothetical protein